LTVPRLASGQPNPGTRSSDRDDEACLHAYQRELDYLVCTLERLGVGPVDIEDLAQDVFLILRANWQHYDPRRPLRPYLFAIAFRVASSHRRRRLREVPVAVVNGPDLALCPDALLEADQARNVVLKVLRRIPLPRRAVLIMHELDDVPVQVVATTLSIPLFTAYSRLRKARRELKSAIVRMQERGAIR
jgi:RNA polymerase sigma-70 factor (ECF subfamily)